MTKMLKGIAASDGVAVAKAYLLVQPDLSFETVSVSDTDVEEARLDAALAASKDELSIIRDKAVGTLGEEAASVFDAHLMVLADPEMIGQIKETIRAKQVNAEAGLKEVTDMFVTHACNLRGSSITHGSVDKSKFLFTCLQLATKQSPTGTVSPRMLHRKVACLTKIPTTTPCMFAAIRG